MGNLSSQHYTKPTPGVNPEPESAPGKLLEGGGAGFPMRAGPMPGADAAERGHRPALRSSSVRLKSAVDFRLPEVVRAKLEARAAELDLLLSRVVRAVLLAPTTRQVKEFVFAGKVSESAALGPRAHLHVALTPSQRLWLACRAQACGLSVPAFAKVATLMFAEGYLDGQAR